MTRTAPQSRMVPVQDGIGALKMPRSESRPEEHPEAILTTTPDASRAGTLTVDGESATLAFERRIPHSVEVVWETLTDPEHLARWYLTKARIEPKAGGQIEFWSGPAQFHITGRVLVWDPPHVFEHERNIEPRKEFPQGERSIIRWELIRDGDGAILRLTHRRLLRKTAIRIAPATHALLDRLEAELDERPMPDMHRRFDEVRAHYPARED